jgi:hypothetical protein
MSIMISDQELLDDWNRAAAQRLESEEYEKWHGIADLHDGTRKIDVAIGEGNPFFGKVANEHASEVLEKAEQALAVAALDVGPALLDPR